MSEELRLSKNALRSRNSYNNNKIRVYRRRILKAIENGRCVLQKTLYDEKYKWTFEEMKMLKKCLDLRRERYLIEPDNINFIRDRRFPKLFPKDNYKEYHKKEMEELNVLEDKLNKIKSLLEKVEHPNVKSIFTKEIKLIEDKIEVNPIRTVSKTVTIPNSQNNNVTPNSNSPNSVNTSINLLHDNVDEIITEYQVVEVHKYLIEVDRMYVRKNDESKRAGFEETKRIIRNLFAKLEAHKYSTSNLLNLYLYPNKYKNMTKNNKKFLGIIYRLYKLSINEDKFLEPGQPISQSIRNISKHKAVKNINIFNDQHNILVFKAKQAELYRQKNAPYYNLLDIQRIPLSIKPKQEGGLLTLQQLKDKILMTIYAFENVVRDDLGLLEIIMDEKDIPDRADRTNFILNKGNYFKIYLNNFKNVASKSDYKFNLSLETSALIFEYIQRMNAFLSNSHTKTPSKYPIGKLKYLFTKDVGEVYQNGKLSKYIISMFSRYSSAKNLGINELRHSVATHFRDKLNEAQKTVLARKMQHSLDQHIRYERYSNSVISLEPMVEKTDRVTNIEDDDFHGKKMKVLFNRKIELGIIKYERQNKSLRRYKVEFTVKNVEKASFFDYKTIYLSLQNENIENIVDKKAKLKLTNNNLRKYSKFIKNIDALECNVSNMKCIEGIVKYNELFTSDELTEQPLILYFDESLQYPPFHFAYPHPDVIILIP
jgi:hypothetical protein